MIMTVFRSATLRDSFSRGSKRVNLIFMLLGKLCLVGVAVA